MPGMMTDNAHQGLKPAFLIIFAESNTKGIAKSIKKYPNTSFSDVKNIIYSSFTCNAGHFLKARMLNKISQPSKGHSARSEIAG